MAAWIAATTGDSAFLQLIESVQSLTRERARFRYLELMIGGAPTRRSVTTLTIERDHRVPKTLKLRRALALPLYVVALVLSFISDGLADLAATLAKDSR